MAGYVELHAHSAYSFLDGASQPEELAVRAAALGYEALALTDHDGVYGSLEFAHAAKAFGVRPITGAEVTLEGGTHVTLLVESRCGYANLCRLLTTAHAGTRRAGREDRIDITYYLLKLMSWMGIIWDLKPVPIAMRDDHPRRIGPRRIVK